MPVAVGTSVDQAPLQTTELLNVGDADLQYEVDVSSLKAARDENFGFQVPVTVHGVDAALLDPRSTWADKDAYDAQAKKLVDMFAENFAQYDAYIDDDVKAVAIG